jgi:crotonobetainyl-CoA:carnitine CoA-transferase CaiB-like acyl-CoA transferase
MPERLFAWPVYDIFETKEGRQIFLGAVTEGQWVALCRLLGLDALLEDPGLQKRMDQIDARHRTVPIFAAAVRTRGFDELCALCEEAGLPFAPIRRPAEMYDDPHVNRPGGLQRASLPEGGSFRAPGLPFEADGASPTSAIADVPAAGADTEAVLGALGLTPAEIATASGRTKTAAVS